MANKIVIELNTEDALTKTYVKQIFSAPLLTDPLIETSSSFTTAGDIFGGLYNLLSNIKTAVTGTSGGISTGLLNLVNKFDLPIWQKTEPAKINIRLGFYLKTDVVKDVVTPIKTLVSQSILSLDSSGEKYITPGISLKSLSELKPPGKTGRGLKKESYTAKIISLWIPGIIYMPYAYIESARPEYSKQRVFKAPYDYYPLWGVVDMQVIGLYPATSDMFDASFSGNLLNRSFNYNVFDQF